MREKRWMELLVATALLLSAAGGFAQGVPTQPSQVIVNDGNLVMEDVPEIVTGGIPWDINDGTISHDRRRLAFVVNENGLSRVYLMDAGTRRYRAIGGRVFFRNRA